MKDFLVDVEERSVMRRKGQVSVRAKNAKAAREQVHFGGIDDEKTEWDEWTGDDETHVKSRV